MASVANEMVHFSDTTEAVFDQSWRWGEQLSGVVTVTLDLTLFEKATDAKKEQYLTGVGATAAEVWIKQGLPLARVTATGLYGPYDPDAKDGRADAVYGLLESDVRVERTFNGWADTATAAGMRIRGNVVVKNMPVIPGDNVAWYGDFVSVDPDTGIAKRLLNNVAASKA